MCYVCIYKCSSFVVLSVKFWHLMIKSHILKCFVCFLHQQQLICHSIDGKDHHIYRIRRNPRHHHKIYNSKALMFHCGGLSAAVFIPLYDASSYCTIFKRVVVIWYCTLLLSLCLLYAAYSNLWLIYTEWHIDLSAVLLFHIRSPLWCCFIISLYTYPAAEHFYIIVVL